MRKKLDKFTCLFGTDEKLSELIEKMIDLYQETTDPNELKTNLATQFKSLKKEVNKFQLSEQDKKSKQRNFNRINLKKTNVYLKGWPRLIPKSPL